MTLRNHGCSSVRAMRKVRRESHVLIHVIAKGSGYDLKCQKRVLLEAAQGAALKILNSAS